MGLGPLGVWEKVVILHEGEVFRSQLQSTYHSHGPLWGMDFSLAPAPKPNECAPKWAQL